MEHRAVKEKELMQRHESLAQKSERLKAVSAEIGASINNLEDQWGKAGKAVKDLRESVQARKAEVRKVTKARHFACQINLIKKLS
jgi:uncharacterized protein YukE